MAVSSGTAKVTLPTETQILIKREFDAPKHLVYRAWTTPELVRRWWTAKRGEMTVCEIDLRVGGAWRYVMVADGGFEVGFHGEYREIVPNERLVSTEAYEGIPDPDANAALNTLTLTEADGRTTLDRARRAPDAGRPRRAHRVGHGSGHAGRDGPARGGRELPPLSPTAGGAGRARPAPNRRVGALAPRRRATRAGAGGAGHRAPGRGTGSSRGAGSGAPRVSAPVEVDPRSQTHVPSLDGEGPSVGPRLRREAATQDRVDSGLERDSTLAVSVVRIELHSSINRAVLMLSASEPLVEHRGRAQPTARLHGVVRDLAHTNPARPRVEALGVTAGVRVEDEERLAALAGRLLGRM